jgi:hypothetical protein
MPNDADPRGDMTKAAETLISFYSFIDIPVEILDFRFDLSMMNLIIRISDLFTILKPSLSTSPPPPGS